MILTDSIELFKIKKEQPASLTAKNDLTYLKNPT